MARRRDSLALIASLALILSCRAGQLFDSAGAGSSAIAVAPSQVTVLASSTSAEWSSPLAIRAARQGGTTPWTAYVAGSATWLTLAQTSGVAPDTLTVVFETKRLEPGTYRDTIVIVPSDAGVPPVRVPVELGIAEAPPPPPVPSLAFTTNPSPEIVVNTVFRVAVTARDAQGRTVSMYTGKVTVRLQGPISSGELRGKVEMNAVSGVATFTDLKVNRTCVGCSLVATATGLSSATSTLFNVVVIP
jgi:hypothetical protein